MPEYSNNIKSFINIFKQSAGKSIKASSRIIVTGTVKIAKLQVQRKSMWKYAKHFQFFERYFERSFFGRYILEKWGKLYLIWKKNTPLVKKENSDVLRSGIAMNGWKTIYVFKL